MSLINTQIQPFEANAYHNGEFIKVSDNSLKGQWSVLIFMPAAFTFNCPTEIEDAANNYGDFDELAVVEGVDLERLDLGVDQVHSAFLVEMG